jgi:hypothetical protein
MILLPAVFLLEATHLGSSITLVKNPTLVNCEEYFPFGNIKKLKALDNYLQGRMAGYIQGEELSDKNAYTLENNVYTTFHSNSCVRSDYQILRKLVKVYEVTGKTIGSVLNSSDFAYANSVNSVNKHLQIIDESTLEKLYNNSIRNGVDKYAQVKGLSEIRRFADSGKQGRYVAITKKLLKILGDEELIQESNRIQEEMESAYTLFDISAKRSVVISALLGEIREVVTLDDIHNKKFDLDDNPKSEKPEDINEFIRYQRLFSKDRIDKDMEKRLLKKKNERKS